MVVDYSNTWKHFLKNGISYKVFAVSDTKEIKTNSGISLTTDDVIANLKGHEDEFDAFVFSHAETLYLYFSRMQTNLII